MAEAVAVVQTVSAIIDCVVICRDGYRKISEVIRTLNEMGEKIAGLQQRFREEECRLWTFALARNLVVDNDHPIYMLPTSLPELWVEVVGNRFALIREHLAEAEHLLYKYDDESSTAVTKLAAGTESGSTVSFENRPLNTHSY